MSYSYNTSSGGGQECRASLNLFEGYAPNPYSGGYAPRPYTYADQQNNNWGNGNYDEPEYYEQQGDDQGDDQEDDQGDEYPDDQGDDQEEEEDDQEEDNQGEDNQGDDYQEEEEENDCQEEEEEDQGEEDDADYDDGINYGTCSSPNCTNICHPEASDRCPICAPRAYDLPQFRYCEAVLVHEVYPSIDVDPYYGYDRGYKYENNPGAHVDNSKPGDLSLTEDEIFCNHPGCYNKINMRRQSYCTKHR